MLALSRRAGLRVTRALGLVPVNPLVLLDSREGLVVAAMRNARRRVRRQEDLLDSDLARLRQLMQRRRRMSLVLCLGDSVYVRTSHEDRDRRSLATMFLSELATEFESIVVCRGGYHLGVFAAFARFLSHMRLRPDFIVIELNIRSFSPQWYLHPDWRFESDIEMIDRSASQDRRPRSDWSSDADRLAGYSASQVSYPDTPFRTVGEFLAIVNDQTRTRDEYRRRMETLFRFHYMHPLAGNHPRLADLDDTLLLLGRMALPTLLYLTPVNYRAGTRWLGKAFLDRHRENSAVIERPAYHQRVGGVIAYHDWSTTLDDMHFVHPNIANEHLNERGRQALMARVVEALRGVRDRNH